MYDLISCKKQLNFFLCVLKLFTNIGLSYHLQRKNTIDVFKVFRYS